MKAVILAGGRGSRLHPHTIDTPKPLLSLEGDQVILDHVFDNLPDQIDEILLVTNYLAEQIVDHVNNHDSHRNISCHKQTERRGTMDALYAVKDAVGTDRFLVLNGDDLYQKSELESFINSGTNFGVSKRIMPPAYYAMDVDNAGVINGFRPQTTEELANGALVATGAYVLDSFIFDIEPQVLKSGEIGLPQTFLKSSSPIQAFEFQYWQPVNTLDDLESVRNGS